MSAVIVIGCILAVCIFTATREQRLEAKQRLAKHNRTFAAIAVVLWTLILIAWFFGRYRSS